MLQQSQLERRPARQGRRPLRKCRVGYCAGRLLAVWLVAAAGHATAWGQLSGLEELPLPAAPPSFSGQTGPRGDALEALPAPVSSPASSHTLPLPRNAGAATEVIRDRYPDGRVRIQRQVKLNEDENYVSHGSWVMFAPNGSKVIEGQFSNGQANGLWTRWHTDRDAAVLQEAPYVHFETPFISQAGFRNGRLHGQWTIYDRSHRKISELSFVDGRRSGVSTWWYASGGKMRELAFSEGKLNGKALYFKENGEIAREELFQESHRVSRHVDYYANKVKRSEGLLRHGETVIVKEDNWWTVELATFEVQGEAQRIGSWTVYHPNGQKMLVGVFERDQPTGAFVYWHANGQRSLTGNYEVGQRQGKWTWWHNNGMKLAQGVFKNGDAVGKWAWWSPDGQIQQSTSEIGDTQNLEMLVEEPAAHNSSAVELPVSADLPEINSN